MNFLTWIIFGLVAGAIAKFLHSGKEPGGWIGSIIVGIIGSMLGGWLGSLLLGVEITGFNLSSMLIAVGGSVLFLAIYSALKK